MPAICLFHDSQVAGLSETYEGLDAGNRTGIYDNGGKCQQRLVRARERAKSAKKYFLLKSVPAGKVP